jgi:hypothetical protein
VLLRAKINTERRLSTGRRRRDKRSGEAQK